MDVFDLDGALIQDYERFARSFTKIRAQDIERQTVYSTAERAFGWGVSSTRLVGQRKVKVMSYADSRTVL